jgi:hypothetical protein
MQWLFTQGGGMLPIDQLLNTLIQHPNTPYTSHEVTAERLCEAIEQLLLIGYAEVRDDSRPKLRNSLSLYDFAPILQYMRQSEIGWKWESNFCPVVALSDEGYRYTSQHK